MGSLAPLSASFLMSLPWELLSFIALEIAMKFGPLYAATLMTMFFGDLRPGDTLMLKMKDITPPVSVHDVWAIHPRRYRGPRVMDSPLLQSWCGPVYASLHRWSKKNMPDYPGCNFAPFPFQWLQNAFCLAQKRWECRILLYYTRSASEVVWQSILIYYTSPCWIVSHTTSNKQW